MVCQIGRLDMPTCERLKGGKPAGLGAAGALGKRPERGSSALRNSHIDVSFHWPYLTCHGF